nr:hypothetical protein [Flavobacterium sp.]
MESNIAFGILIAVFFISLIVLFCVLIVKLYINKIKTYTRVIYEKDLEFQRTLNTTIIETQEQVLTNISHDLHDDAGQQLTYINFQLENLKLDSPDLQNIMAPVSESLTQLSSSIRRISHSLNNHLIMQQDLIRSIRAEADRLNSNKELTVSMKSDIERRMFDKNQHIVIYRIFQETINNILKHAKADTITIDIIASPFKLVVTDNGKGFDMKDSRNKRSLGMHTMSQRAALIG